MITVASTYAARHAAMISALLASLIRHGPVWGPPVQVTDDAVLGRVAGAFAAKWDGRWQWTARGGCFRDPDGRGEAMVFSVTPAKVFAYAKGDPFGATTHQFRLAGSTPGQR